MSVCGTRSARLACPPSCRARNGSTSASATIAASSLLGSNMAATRSPSTSGAGRGRWNAGADEVDEKKLSGPKTPAAVAAELAMPAEQTQTRFPAGGILAEHVVVPGDSLSKLALAYYGDVALAAAIAESNR